MKILLITEELKERLTEREVALAPKLRDRRAKLRARAKQEKLGFLSVNASINDALRNPDAGNLHVRFDERD